MKFLHSIRSKLTLWYTALLAATLVGFGGISYLFTRSTLSNNLDLSLHSEVKWVNEFIEPRAKKVRLKRSALLELQQLKKTTPLPAEVGQDNTDTTGTDEIWNQIYQQTILSPRRQYIQILDRNGDLLYRSPSLGKQKLDYTEIPYGWVNIVTIRDEQARDLRLAITQNDYVKIFVAYPLEELNEALDGIFMIFRILAPIALLISVIGGWFLAHRSLKPVDAITRTAQMISAQNLNQRLPAKGVDDELGRLTATFNDMIGRLQESFAEIQRFSGDASHELRTPLTIMRGEIEVALRKKRLPVHTRELLTSIHDELVRLSSIVESLMTLIKSESGRLTFQFDEVSLDSLVREIAEDTLVLASARKIKVSVREVESVTVRGDAARLRQLLLNLVENAVKYTPDRGTVTLALTKVGSNASILVSDTGIGIPKKDLPKVFDRFYRVKADGTGSGLGLAIAKWIAEAHHGSIQVTSREKKGSTFTVLLPLVKSTT
ncbi:MAG: ATP-binding protein [Ignavibacteriales bacterium]|nr:ATP-binding protein [Ignavibacteriales bacterium]